MPEVERTGTGLPGVQLLTPRVFGDARGWFSEVWNRRDFAAAGVVADFCQDNQSRSARGVLRGLHYQLPHAQAKLVRVLAGRVYDVAVDIRRDSPHFGRWVGVVLDAVDRRQLFVPKGFAHGFLVLSEHAEFLYKVDDRYAPEAERGIAWNDPDLGIAWPLDELGGERPQLSGKDAELPRLADLPRDALPTCPGDDA